MNGNFWITGICAGFAVYRALTGDPVSAAICTTLVVANVLHLLNR